MEPEKAWLLHHLNAQLKERPIFGKGRPSTEFFKVEGVSALLTVMAGSRLFCTAQLRPISEQPLVTIFLSIDGEFRQPLPLEDTSVTSKLSLTGQLIINRPLERVDHFGERYHMRVTRPAQLDMVLQLMSLDPSAK